ncbi:MAG: site-specific integrase [Nanoarchaeota archaeon]|nr:site-specific integrase [Nanoarchaeota archaeon]
MVSENNTSPSSKRDEKGVKKQQMNPEIYLSEDPNKIEAVSHIPTKKNSGIGFKSYKMGPKTSFSYKYIDPLKKRQLYETWKKKTKNGIPGITQANSDLILKFVGEMELGINVSKLSKPGKRSPTRLHSLGYHLRRVAELVEQYHNKKCFADLQREDIHKLFDDMKEGRILSKKGTPYLSPDDYIRDFICFWNWFMKIEALKREKDILKKGKTNRKEVFNIIEYLNRARKENKFVYFTYDQLKQVLPHLTKNFRVLALFLFDSIVRSPSEASNLYISDLGIEKDEVFVNIRQEVSKTYGRKFNLVLCDDEVKEYIKRNKLGPQDLLFPFYKMKTFNKTLQKAFIKVFGDMMTPGGKPYSELTGYAFRHSGACYLRSLRGVSIDKLMVRGGWSNLRRINYYTRFLGLDGRIERERLIEQPEINENMMKVVQTQNEEIAKLRKEILQIISVTIKEGFEISQLKELPLQEVKVVQNA